jgi:tetratricopeptide (TPR) repeat protein
MRRTALIIATGAAIGAAVVLFVNTTTSGPSLPGLDQKPARLQEEIREAYRLAQRGPDDAAVLGRWAMTLHANAFYEAAMHAYQRTRETDRGNPRLCYSFAILNQDTGNRDQQIALLNETVSAAPDYVPAQLRLADALRAANRSAEAETHYRSCREHASLAPFANVGLARLAIDRGEWQSAANELRAALETLPTHGPALDLLAVALGELGLDEEMRATRRHAESALRGLQPPDPWHDELFELCFDPHTLLVMADAAVQVEDGPRASQLYQQAIAAAPQDTGVRIEFGIALIKQKQYGDAIRSLEEALALDPSNVDAHVQLSNALLGENRIDDAGQIARKAVNLDGKSAEAHNALGAALTRAGLVEQAVRAYRDALDLDPDHARANVNLANVLSQAGQLDAAAQHYRHALAISSRDEQALIGLGAVLVRQDRLEDAEENYRRALLINPDSAGAHYDLGVIRARRGDVEQAIREYREAIRLEPSHYPALFNLGAELTAQGKFQEAVARFKRALLVQPNSADLHNNLGFTYSRLGDNERAAVHYRRALAIDPDHAQAKANLDQL